MYVEVLAEFKLDTCSVFLKNVKLPNSFNTQASGGLIKITIFLRRHALTPSDQTPCAETHLAFFRFKDYDVMRIPCS